MPLISSRNNSRTASCLLRLFLVLGLMLATGCTEYWWTRGQPPGVPVVFKRAQTALLASIGQNKTSRTDISATTEALAQSLADAYSLAQNSRTEELRAKLGDVRGDFMKLEGKLSIGSRASYGELSGQLRTIIDSSGKGETNPETLGLFAARTFFFLSNELTVPAPVF